MYVLNTEKRNLSLKGKQLRKSGLVSGSICGGNLNETLLVQLTQREAKKLLKSKAKGGNVLLICDDVKYNALLKDVSYVPVSGDIENLSFQCLLDGDIVTGTAQIVLLNRDRVPMMVQQILNEISYKALPGNLVERIEVDVEGMAAGSCVRVEDLQIAKNPEIELLVGGDSVVFQLVEARNAPGTEAVAEVK